MIKREALKSTGDTSERTLTDEDGNERTEYEVDFGKGPIKLDLDPGDEAQFLESKHPSANFQAFTQLVLTVGLKALDIPYSFYDEAHTNFFGSRGAWLHYERASQDKRETLQELLDRITLWRTILWILDGELVLPRGMDIGELAWEWVPMGMPWWDPAKEINGDVQAIGAGLDNPQRITKERGRGDWYDNIDEISKALKYAEKKEVPVSFAPVPQVVEVVEKEEGAKNGK